MSNDHHNLIAFLAVLLSIVLLVVIAVVAASRDMNIEAVGVGGVITGLIGVLGTFRPRARQNDTGAS